MKYVHRAWFLAALLVATGNLMGTTPIGVYGVIEKVRLEPEQGTPERAQVWGAFSIVKPEDGTFHDPARGYLYFSLKKGAEDASRKEWEDLKAAAGSGKILAFGSRWEQKTTLRKESEKPEKPDVYTITIGVREVSKDTNYVPIRSLAKLVSPLQPMDGESVPAGSVTLRARELGGKEHPKAKVQFELEGPDGAKESSEASAPVNGDASWSPKMKLESGKKYSWRAWAVDGDWKGTARSAVLRVK